MPRRRSPARSRVAATPPASPDGLGRTLASTSEPPSVASRTVPASRAFSAARQRLQDHVRRARPRPTPLPSAAPRSLGRERDRAKDPRKAWPAWPGLSGVDAHGPWRRPRATLGSWSPVSRLRLDRDTHRCSALPAGCFEPGRHRPVGSRCLLTGPSGVACWSACRSWGPLPLRRRWAFPARPAFAAGTAARRLGDHLAGC